MEKGCIILRDKKGNTKKYPMFETEIGEVVLQSGNLVSMGVLSALGFWQIDVLVTTRNGYPYSSIQEAVIANPSASTTTSTPFSVH